MTPETLLKINLVQFCAAFLISFFLVPRFKNIAVKYNIVDRPDQNHKTHSKPIPYLGGVAIAASFFLNLLLNLLMFGENYVTRQNLTLLATAITILTLGLLDDIYNLSPKTKLSFQFVLATTVLSQIVNLNLNIGITNYGVVNSIIALVWIIGLTNAFNLLDNFDGVVPLTSFVTFGSLGIVAFANSNSGLSLQSFMLSGACLGFFLWNKNPASIYLGDSGAMFLGYNAAIMLLQNNSIASTRLESIIIPIFLVALPIIDTSTVIIYRFVKRKPLLVGDTNHISHRLLSLGIRKSFVLFLMVLLHTLFATVAVLLSY